MKTDSNGRNWPFTMRVTIEERRLLREAAKRLRKRSQAEVARLALDPLFARLSLEHAPNVL
jgi:hypothetical protein